MALFVQAAFELFSNCPISQFGGVVVVYVLLGAILCSLVLLILELMTSEVTDWKWVSCGYSLLVLACVRLLA